MGTHPIPVLALSEGALPGKGSLSGYVSYSAPSIPTFLYGSAAVYVRKDIPQCVVDTSSLSSANLEVVAVQVTAGLERLQLLFHYTLKAMAVPG